MEKVETPSSGENSPDEILISEAAEETAEANPDNETLQEQEEIKRLEGLEHVRSRLDIPKSEVGPKSEPEHTIENRFITLESVKKFKNCAHTLRESFSRLSGMLDERDRDRLTALIGDRDARFMHSEAKKIAENKLENDDDFDDIAISVATIRRLAGTICTVPSRSLREDLESLKKVAYALKMAYEDALRVNGVLKKMGTNKSISLARNFNNLGGTLDDRRSAVLRRMNQVGELSRLR